MSKKNTGRKALPKTLIIFFFMVFFMIFTVSAWVAENNKTLVNVDDVTVKAAKIAAEASVDIKYYMGDELCYYGVPGETAKATITITDLGSTRDYVYRVDFSSSIDVETVTTGEITTTTYYLIGYDGNGKKVLGTVKFPDGYVDEKGIYYGLMHAPVTAPNNTKDVILEFYFYGDEVLYDGISSMGDEFNSAKIKCCQATPAAVMDVFELDLTTAKTLCGMGEG